MALSNGQLISGLYTSDNHNLSTCKLENHLYKFCAIEICSYQKLGAIFATSLRNQQTYSSINHNLSIPLLQKCGDKNLQHHGTAQCCKVPSRALKIPSFLNPEHQSRRFYVVLWYLKHELNFHLHRSCFGFPTFVSNPKRCPAKANL